MSITAQTDRYAGRGGSAEDQRKVRGSPSKQDRGSGREEIARGTRAAVYRAKQSVIKRPAAPHPPPWRGPLVGEYVSVSDPRAEDPTRSCADTLGARPAVAGR